MKNAVSRATSRCRVHQTLRVTPAVAAGLERFADQRREQGIRH